MLRKRATLDLADFAEVFENAKTPAEALQISRQLGISHLLKRATTDRAGNLRLDFYNSDKALELLGKQHRLFTDRVSLDATDIRGVVERMVEVIRECVKDQDLYQRIQRRLIEVADEWARR